MMAVKTYAALAIMLAISLQLIPSASNVNASLGHYLSAYISNSTLSLSTVINQTVNGTNYIMVVLPGTDNFTVLSGSGGTYSFVTGVSEIDQVLTPYLSASHYPSKGTINMLNATMQEYRKYGATNTTDCIDEVGLNQNTCTMANNCFSCQTVPVCKKVLTNFGGVNTTLGLGLVNFSVKYAMLNDSYNSYFSILSGINRNNAASVISQLSTIAANISSLSSTFNHNPIFPPPANLTFGDCSSGASPLKQPWYCVAVGFCSVIPFNSTALNKVQSTLTELQAGLVPPSGVLAISANVSNSTLALLNGLHEKQSSSQFDNIINTYSPQYNSIVAKSQALLARYDSSSLSLSLQKLVSGFGAIKGAGSNQSLGAANTTLLMLIANATKAYNSASSNYSTAYSMSQNNTASLLAAELDYKEVPARLAELSNQQQNINMGLNKRINSSQAASIIAQVRSISLETAAFSAPFDLGYATKAIDAPFLTSLLSGSNTPAQQKLAMAPLYAALLSLAIGILVVLVLFAIAYSRIIKKGKMKGNKHHGRKLYIVFMALIIIVAIYSSATYAFAQGAGSFMPFSYFAMSVRASPTVYIALNGSAASNSSIASCANTVQTYLASSNKSVKTIQLRNYSCISGSNISTLGLGCYSSILDSGRPVIFISQSQQNVIVHRGLYGTVLYASGSAVTGNACTLSTLFRHN